MNITEPMTLLTDYALGTVAGVMGISLRRIGRVQHQVSTKWWAGAFIAVALAAFIGGTCHGAGHILGQGTLAILWKATIVISGFISFFILVAAATKCLSQRWHLWVIGIAVIKLVLYLVWISSHHEFRYVIFDYGSVLIVALCLYGFAYHLNTNGALWIIGGLLLSVVAAIFQHRGLDLSVHFNHNDLYHVIQIGAMYLLYRGVKIGDAKASMVKKA